ncbi:hypothetical protein PRUPE_2G139000 [Prunus persica]|uniref:Bifunctional inhibitor/plant lipid transfer protein/seed storage helical domain-containing protein n=2 Tax=Prunus persica TaxID=3760 RepID=A0A251QFI2_PRUPE|nr:hypothetical protein PRUPE_2G139000 [Prunus persica]
MASAFATIALLLSLNLVFFTTVSSDHHVPTRSPTPPKTPKHPPLSTPTSTLTQSPLTLIPTPEQPPSTLTLTPTLTPSPSPSPPKASCPKDTLKLGVCGDLLNDLLHPVLGTLPKTPCCSLIVGLADVDAAVCLCTAIKANVLGINLNVPVSLNLLLKYCGKSVPKDFQCT